MSIRRWQLTANARSSWLEIDNEEGEWVAYGDYRRDAEWKPITEENRPKVGDEIGGWDYDEWVPAPIGTKAIVWRVSHLRRDIPAGYVKSYLQTGWTHFRPLNPPPRKLDKENNENS